jgi:hypothetical protein
MAAAPILALFCSNTFNSVTIIRAPEHPRGCPSDTAPPLTFTLSLSKPKILELARPTTANASLNSK